MAKRSNRAKRFETWDAVCDFLDELVFKVDSIYRRTPTGTMSPEMRRHLRRAIGELSEAMSCATIQKADERELLQRVACARLRARGLPELPAMVKKELRRMKATHV